jgi:hypothetical protein
VTKTPSVSSLFDEVAGPSPDVSSESQDVLARKSIDARVAEEQPEDAKRAEVEAPKRAITPPEIMKRTVAPVQNQTPFSGKVKIKMKKAHFSAKTLQVPAKTMTPVPTKTTQTPAKTTTLGLLETMQVPAKTTPAPTKTSSIPVKASPSSDGLSDVPSNISAPPSVSFGHCRNTQVSLTYTLSSPRRFDLTVKLRTARPTTTTTILRRNPRSAVLRRRSFVKLKHPRRAMRR